jgi:integrase
MSRPKSLKPKYSHHKSSGRAFVVIDGKFVYLGDYGTQASRDEYDRVIGEWIARGRRSVLPTDATAPEAGVTISMVIHAFWEHAKKYYVNCDGAPTSEQENLRQALRPLKRLYGPTSAARFGPLALKAVREEMLRPTTYTDKHTGKTKTRPGWARTHVNRQIARLKSVFKWAVSMELVPAPVYHGLATVAGLKRGRTEARESEPVKPVPQQHVDAIKPHVSRQVWAMVQLQLLTGMRPGEACAMRAVDVDASGEVWVYRPTQHKTLHHGHVREIHLGPRAKTHLQPFLKPDLTGYLFSPAEAVAEWREHQRAKRKTPVQPSQVARGERARCRQPGRAPGDHYTRESYRRAIARGCRKANQQAHKENPGVPSGEVLVPTWHPHSLRHNAATDLRRRFGIEVARIILGHRSAAITEVYAEADVRRAAEVMAQVG